MTRDREHDVVVARVGDRTYTVPKVCSNLVRIDERGEVSVEVAVVDERVVYRSIQLHLRVSMTPSEVQRIPWAKIAEAVVAAAAVGGQADRISLRDARKRAASNRRARDFRRENPHPGSRARARVTTKLLREVLRYRKEARARGEKRWDDYAARQLNYTPVYLRQLASRAKREGVTLDD